MKIQFDPGDRVVVVEMYRFYNKTNKYENWYPIIGTIVEDPYMSNFDYAVRFNEVPFGAPDWVTKDSVWWIDQHQIDIFQQCCMEAMADD